MIPFRIVLTRHEFRLGQEAIEVLCVDILLEGFDADSLRFSEEVAQIISYKRLIVIHIRQHSDFYRQPFYS